MKLKSISAKRLDIPFKINFKHALANRVKTESVLVSVKSSTENTGYGEGCPRPYVTNESVDTALNFIGKYCIYLTDHCSPSNSVEHQFRQTNASELVTVNGAGINAYFIRQKQRLMQRCMAKDHHLAEIILGFNKSFPNP